MLVLGVVGAGVMGSGIASLAIHRGQSVILLDVDGNVLSKAPRIVRQQLRTARMMGRIPAVTPPGELTTTPRFAELANADVVIEAVTERTAVKTEVLRAISAAVDGTTPIVSNTSGIPVDELAEAVAEPQRMAVVHFMNPAYLHDTVELVAGPRTSEKTLAAVRDLLAQLGLGAIQVGDRPGFVVNSLLQPMIMAAIRLLDAGVATAEQIDEAVTRCLGHATGPLRTADLIGLDNVADTGVELAKRTGEPAFEPPPLLSAKVAAGDLGRKSGRGFYDYGGAP